MAGKEEGWGKGRTGKVRTVTPSKIQTERQRGNLGERLNYDLRQNFLFPNA